MKISKLIIAMLLIVFIATVACQAVLAQSSNGYDARTEDLSTMFMSSTDDSGASTAAANIISMIISIAQVIGAGVAIIMLIVLAIQYIAASPEGKAEIKKNSTIYIVGAVILFAASGILGIIRRFAVKGIGTQASGNIG